MTTELFKVRKKKTANTETLKIINFRYPSFSKMFEFVISSLMMQLLLSYKCSAYFFRKYSFLSISLFIFKKIREQL